MQRRSMGWRGYGKVRFSDVGKGEAGQSIATAKRGTERQRQGEVYGSGDLRWCSEVLISEQRHSGVKNRRGIEMHSRAQQRHGTDSIAEALQSRAGRVLRRKSMTQPIKAMAKKIRPRSPEKAVSGIANSTNRLYQKRGGDARWHIKHVFCVVVLVIQNATIRNIFGGANRKLSEKDGLVVDLCHACHNETPNGVHFNIQNMRKLQRYGQRMFEDKWMEARNSTREQARIAFRLRYGRNYIMEDSE